VRFPRHPTSIVFPVGSITIARSTAVAPGHRANRGRIALSPIGSSSRPKKSNPASRSPAIASAETAAASSSMTARAPFISDAPRPTTELASKRPGTFPFAGTVSTWPARTISCALLRLERGRKNRTPSPSSASSKAPEGTSSRIRCRMSLSSRSALGMRTSSSVRAARRSASSGVTRRVPPDRQRRRRRGGRTRAARPRRRRPGRPSAVRHGIEGSRRRA
jgi:hypothetical protein